MRKIFFLTALLVNAQIIMAQTQLPIPPMISGNSIDLYMADSFHYFYPGSKTSSIGYNGSYLGPTIILDKWQAVTLKVHNMLTDTTTTHWHGLHVVPANDGSPHNSILPASTWSPSFTVMDNAALYWYHPHPHGKTMAQVLKGAAGLIIVRDSLENALTLPRTYGVDDIPLVFQFQTIDTVTKQIVIDDEMDNVTMVNGVINPYVNVPAQIVRLRLLNASSHRIFELGFNDNRTFMQITSDAGLLDAPVSMVRLRLAPGERAEVLVNFSGQQGNSYFIRQYGSTLPQGFPGGPPMMGQGGPLDGTDFDLLKINIVASTSSPVTTIPSSLTVNTIYSTVGAGNFNLNFTAQPMNSMTNFFMNGTKFDEHVINFITKQDSVMKWNITNQTMMAHPLHIHGNHFYVLSVNGAAPPASMQGRKDVVLVPPQGGTVQLITKYLDFSDPMMPYMYHCHILSHEDNGMMGQFIVNPNPASVNELSTHPSIDVFPNPVADETSLRISSGNLFVSEVSVLDFSGRKIKSEKLGKQINELRFCVSDLTNGIYFIEVITPKGKFFSRLVVSKR